MQRFLIAGILWAMGCAAAFGQGTPNSSQVVTACGNAVIYQSPQVRANTQDANGRQCVSAGSAASATTQGNGTITVGNTFQTIAAANPGRQSLDFINTTGNGDLCWLFFGAGTASTAASVPVQDTQEYLRSSGAIPGDVIQATCATNGDAFYLGVQ